MKKIIIVWTFVLLFCMQIQKTNVGNNSLNILPEAYYTDGGNQPSATYVYERHNLSDVYSEQMPSFFRNFTNIPENNNPRLGFCFHLALAMVLTYYDTYYNNSIVPDAMLNKATINLNDLAHITSLSFPSDNFPYTDLTKTRSNYLNNAANYVNTNLLDNCIMFAYNNGYLDGNTLGVRIEDTCDYIDDYLIHRGCSSIFTHTNSYISTLSSFELFNGKYTFNSVDIATSQTYKSQIMTYLSLGYPVIVHHNYLYDEPGSQLTSCGHTVIAFATKSISENTQIIYNLGYSNENNSWISGDYIVRGYDVIIPTTYNNHSCSQNYIDGATNNYVCPEDFSNHSHIYVNYTSVNNFVHKKTCYCGHHQNESHDIFENHGVSYCRKCNYSSSGNNPIYLNKKEDEEF